MARSTLPENELGMRWDRCLSDLVIKIAAGAAVGAAGSLLLFKRRRWPVLLGSGFGIGLAYGNCQTELGNAMSPHPHHSQTS